MSINIISTENFVELRAADGYYVDKTGFLVDFLRNDAHPDRFDSPKASAVLFTRPRRFGKSLFMSMLANFFDMSKDSRKFFAGLKVATHERLCEEWMNKYPVIFFTFKEMRRPTFDRTLSAINDLIGEFCENHKYLLTSERVLNKHKVKIRKYMSEEPDEDALRSALRVLSAAMTAHHGVKAILLVDEYDDLLDGALEHGFYAEMVSFLRSFLSAGLKTNYDNVRFSVLTGILRLAKESLFSTLNNLRCYDIDSSTFDDLFGFTQSEVDALLAAEGVEDKRDVIREWYDGYRFGNRGDIYNPWSIMEYLSNLKGNHSQSPRSYWLETGRKSLPKDFATRLPREEDILGKVASLNAGNGVVATINMELNYDVVFNTSDNFWTLLYLSGYLTRTEEPSFFHEGMDDEQRVLVIPNKEIKKIFKFEVETWVRKIIPGEKERDKLYDSLWKMKGNDVEEVLNDMLVRNGLHYQKEIYYHGIVKGAFDMRYPETTSSGQGGSGIYDLLVLDSANSRAAVLEFKRAPSEEKLEEYARKGLKQIDDRDYDARVRANGCKTILHVGIAFYRHRTKVLFRDASARLQRSSRRA